jgi:hypothetical protein
MERWERLHRASFHPDLLLVPERDDDAPRFGRALPADSAAPLFASERLKKRLEDAVTSFGGCSHLAGELTGQHGDSMVINRASVESVRNQGTAAECPRTITDGVHPGTKCRKTGKAPIHGWRYESTDRDADPHDLSAAAYAELDSTARAAYVRRAPVAYAPLEEPTDEDDGHLTLALPGSRRALAMLLQGDAELQLSGNGHGVGDDDVCSTILKLRGQTDSRFLLAEYLELTCKLELDEHAASADVVLDCLFDDDDAESMTSTETVRIFRAITQRWPKYTCTGQDKSLGVSGKCSIARSLRAQLPRLLKRIMMNEDEDEAKEKGEQGQDGLQDEAAVGNKPLRRLTDHLPSLSLEQLAEVLDWLPTEKLERLPRLQGSVKLADVPLSRSGYSSVACIPVQLQAEATARHAEGALGKLEVGMLLYMCTQHGKRATFGFPHLDVPQLDGIEAYDMSATLTNLLDTTRVKTMSSSFIYPEHHPDGGALDFNIKDMLVEPKAAPPRMQTEREMLIAQCSLTLSLTRRASSLRLAVLQRWAAAHSLRGGLPLMAAAAPPPATLASPSIGALICFYAECIARLEAKPGAASSLRATVLDASLVPHAVRSAATLCALVRERAASLDVDTLKRLLSSRPLPPHKVEAAEAKSKARVAAETMAKQLGTAAAAAAAVQPSTKSVRAFRRASREPTSASTRSPSASGSEAGAEPEDISRASEAEEGDDEPPDDDDDEEEAGQEQAELLNNDGEVDDYHTRAQQRPIGIPPPLPAAPAVAQGVAPMETEAAATEEKAEAEAKAKAEAEGTAAVEGAAEAVALLDESLAQEEAALLEALAPWGATHSVADIARIAPCLRLDLLPLATVAEHVFTPGRLLSAASIDDAIGRPLREALSDALLPGVRHLRLSSLQDDPPAELACVISMEVMVDPVTAADGKSYERASIEAYWKQQGGKPISPVTREVLPTSNLVPNINLRSICHEYRQRHARSKAAATSTEQLTLSALHAAHLRTKALQMAPLITRAVHQACEAAAAGARVTAGTIGKRARAQPTWTSDDNSKLGKRACAGSGNDGEHEEEHGEGDDRGAEGASLEAEGAVEGAAKENGGQGGKKAMRTAGRPQGGARALLAAAAADVTADAYDPKGCGIA